MKDQVFGEMTYKHSWTKKDSFLFLDKPYAVNITAQAYKGDDILASQQSNYTNYKAYIENNKNEIETKLIEYCQAIYKTDENPIEHLKPTTILFERDNSWGILFETKHDAEHGLGMFIIDGNIKIGPQDLFL